MTHELKPHDYREYLRQALEERRAAFGKDFTFNRLAAACRVQPSYLSSVLRGNGHLNADQVYMACEFLRFNEAQYRYTSLLHEWERSIYRPRRQRLEHELQSLGATS